MPPGAAAPAPEPGDPPTGGLTHLDSSGAARMVDVSHKHVTARTARATGRVLVTPEVVALLRGEGLPKGDALATARLAGIMGAKRTPELVPLCHPLALSGVNVDLEVTDEAVAITATVRTTDRTGVEMEALTAVSVAALTVVDMVKAVDKAATITGIRVETKTGGKSGDWHRDGRSTGTPGAEKAGRDGTGEAGEAGEAGTGGADRDGAGGADQDGTGEAGPPLP
ncbi:molybdenum cofactor biosynthesis protein C [Streptomyces sp. SPB074]|nr:molybdenum cofactor biosynthesis protein C [Streptomyces sp. SPB074]